MNEEKNIEERIAIIKKEMAHISADIITQFLTDGQPISKEDIQKKYGQISQMINDELEALKFFDVCNDIRTLENEARRRREELWEYSCLMKFHNQ